MDRISNQVMQHTNIRLLVLFAGMVFLGNCATVKARDTHIRFKNYVGEKSFSPREKHASVSRESGAELLKKGYMPIGNIKVTQPADRLHKVDPAKKAQMIASDYGGDIITFSVYNVERVEMKKKRTKCLKKRRQKMSVWDPYEGIDVWRDVEECIKWEYTTTKRNIIESRGEVWRKGPEILKQKADVILFKVVEENRPSLARMLLKTVSINVNTRDRFGWTPLMFAAYYGGDRNLELARLLIEKSANVKAKDRNGKTALMKALASENMDISKLLIESGADVNAKDVDGRKAMNYASEGVRKEIEQWMKGRN